MEARVEGKMVAMPVDLYIPPHALQVILETTFEGPLDLLLYLIRRHNLDIINIDVAKITYQYIASIELMESSQFELAGEYLVMAATLAEIKSRSLLPRTQALDDDEEDPRVRLIKQLQEYERFKLAAEDLDSLPRLERDIVIANAEAPNKSVVIKLPEVTLKELLVAFHDILKRVEMNSELHLKKETLSVRQRMVEIINRIHTKKFIDFIDLFNPIEGRIGVAITFLAILELLKDATIEVVQNEEFAPIHIRVSSSVHSIDS